MVYYKQWQACVFKDIKIFCRREAIYYVNIDDHDRYKYIERSLRINHDEDHQVNASIFGATKFNECALVHPHVWKNMSYLGLGLGFLDG